LLAGEIVDGATVEISTEGAALTIDGKPTHGPARPILRTVGNA
jgi:ATP-dependent Clp protease ATP-binding subunit ClpB